MLLSFRDKIGHIRSTLGHVMIGNVVMKAAQSKITAQYVRRKLI